MLDFVPNLYDVFYHVSGGSSGGTFARQMAAVAMYLPMARLLEHHKPDLLVCTHPFPEGAAALWKRFHDEKLCLAAVLTDYSLHQIWIYRHVDIFFTATEEMRKGLLNMGLA
jgi:processive 1,2-diacylglycerol beta-glucosyltransferase